MDIKFRGKDTDSGKWVYGFYFQLNGCEYIIKEGTGYFDISYGEEIFATAYCYEIEEGTVGQYTGLKDKHGKEIYKGDILTDILGCKFEIKYKNCSFVTERPYKTNDYISLIYLLTIKKLEVIGNICDNPELINS